MSFETGPSAARPPPRPARVLPLVTGAILRPDADVRLDGYGHAWIAPASLAPTTLAPLNDEERLVEGLRDFARHAAPRRAALLDGQPQGCGRDAAALARLSTKSGVAIAAVTGFHLPAYDPTGRRPWITADAAVATFQRELDGGMREQPLARPAAVAAALGADPPDHDPCWDAAVEACRRSGALLLVRMEQDADLAGLMAYLTRRGVPGERTYVCRMDAEPDDGLHRELAGTGGLLGYGARGTGDAAPGALAALERRLEDGHAGAVAIGLELAEPGAWGGDRPGDGPARDRRGSSPRSSGGCATSARPTTTSTPCWARTCWRAPRGPRAPASPGEPGDRLAGGGRRAMGPVSDGRWGVTAATTRVQTAGGSWSPPVRRKCSKTGTWRSTNLDNRSAR